MTIDPTFWVAISFVIFIGVLVYLKVPQKINNLLNNMILDIKKEIKEAEKLREETKNLLSNSQVKLQNAQLESKKIIDLAKKNNEKMVLEMNEKFFNFSENRKKLVEKKIEQIKENAIKDIKNASVKIAIESARKIIATSIDKSKLDNLFNKNLEETKDTLKNTRV